MNKFTTAGPNPFLSGFSAPGLVILVVIEPRNGHEVSTIDTGKDVADWRLTRGAAVFSSMVTGPATPHRGIGAAYLLIVVPFARVVSIV